MSDVNNVFVRADAAEFGNNIIRQVRRLDFEAPSAVRGTADGTLLFCPAKRIQAEGWPMMHGIAARIHLLFEAQQAEMPGLVRTKSGNFDIVAKQVGIF